MGICLGLLTRSLDVGPCAGLLTRSLDVGLCAGLLTRSLDLGPCAGVFCSLWMCVNRILDTGFVMFPVWWLRDLELGCSVQELNIQGHDGHVFNACGITLAATALTDVTPVAGAPADSSPYLFYRNISNGFCKRSRSVLRNSAALAPSTIR